MTQILVYHINKNFVNIFKRRRSVGTLLLNIFISRERRNSTS